MFVCFVYDFLDFGVNYLGGWFGKWFFELVFVVVEVEWFEFFGYVLLGDYGGGYVGDFFEVVRSIGGDGGEVKFFRDVIVEGYGYVVYELVGWYEVSVGGGEVLGVIESILVMGDDGYFEERVSLLEVLVVNSVISFVIGNCFFFFGVEDERFVFEIINDMFDGLFEVDYGNIGSVGMSSYENS